MSAFWDGFEKQAGLMDKLKSWWRGGVKGTEIVKPVVVKPAVTSAVSTPPVATKPAEYAERKPPKYFYSKKLDAGHVKSLNKSIKRNFKGTHSPVTLKYTKANGEQVTRKVTPYTAKHKGKVMVGYDHHRQAVRSFRVDRIGSMT